jgi:hypothetical protein
VIGEGGNPFPYYLKVMWGQVGNFTKVLGVPKVYFNIYEILSKRGGHPSSKRMINLGCGLG